MNKERINDRFSSYAKVLMEGIPGYMRDISGEGFKFVTMLPCSPLAGDKKDITVLPQDSAFSPFSLKGEIRWVKKDSGNFLVCGIRIEKFESASAAEIYNELRTLFSR